LDGRGKPVTLGEYGDYNASRRIGEEISKFLDLCMEDSSSGTTVKREAGSMDESIRDQVKRTRKQLGLPPSPIDMKTKVSQKGLDTVLEIPASGFSSSHLFLIAMGLVIPTIVFFSFLRPRLNDKTPDFFVNVNVIFFILLPFLSTSGVVISMAMKTWRISLSSSSVKVEERSIISRTHELRSQEIEELEVSQSPNGLLKILPKRGVGGILMRSDKKSVTFGGHLSDPEMRFLHALIKSIIAS
jgi:hypothetical protein